MRSGIVLAGASAFALMAASPASAATFAFDDLIGTLTNFSITAGALSATFSSTSPRTFAVGQPFGLYSFPVALGDYGAMPGDPLTTTFSDPVMDTVLIPFGIEQAFATEPATLVATANTGQIVEFTTAFNDLLSGAPEGLGTFTPTSPITSITLSSPLAYAIASVDLQPPAPDGVVLPEPLSIVLLGTGLAGMIGLRRRRA